MSRHTKTLLSLHPECGLYLQWVAPSKLEMSNHMTLCGPDPAVPNAFSTRDVSFGSFHPFGSWAHEFFPRENGSCIITFKDQTVVASDAAGILLYGADN